MSADPFLATVAVTVVAGVAGQVAARRMRVPAIVPLLFLGVLLGPDVAGLVQPASLTGAGLRAVVACGVAIILFEGGLSLKVEAFRFSGQAIRNLVAFGSLVTWGLAALAAALCFPSLGAGPAALFGALVIVTGPTVIQPLLSVVRPRKRVGDILRGEAILIDPVGALYAVLVLEFLVEREAEGVGHVLLAFGQRVWLGVLLGGGAAVLLSRLLRRQDVLVAELRNLTALAVAIGIYALSEAIVPESGVLTVTMAGFLLGWLAPPGLEEIEEFKGQLTMLMVSVVFVLLSANLSLSSMAQLGWPGAATVLLLLLVARPACIFLCTLGTDLSTRERLFLSWVAPRGIVAASVSSLFALVLADHGMAAEGETVMNLTFAVIAGTVLVQGPTAGLVGRLLGVLEEKRHGFLIVGADPAALAIARALDRAGKRVVLVDTNRWRVEQAREAGLRALLGDALDEHTLDRVDVTGLGALLALTPNDAVNRLAVRLYAREFDAARAIRMASSPEHDPRSGAPPYLFGRRLSREELVEKLRLGHTIERAEIDEEEVALDELARMLGGAIPLFAFGDTGKPRFLADDAKLHAGEALFYLAPPEAEEASAA